MRVGVEGCAVVGVRSGGVRGGRGGGGGRGVGGGCWGMYVFETLGIVFLVPYFPHNRRGVAFT